MVGVAGSLQYPVLLVISALALLASFGFVGLSEVEGSECGARRGAPGLTESRMDAAHSLHTLRPERITVFALSGHRRSDAAKKLTKNMRSSHS